SAENIFHDLGIISMVTSDSQARGRVGESFMRTFQMASYMKDARGKLKEDADGNDNFRVLRYLAQITLNPAICYGISDVLGSIEKGKMADLVLWEPAFFGVKPQLVIKGGLINWANMGYPNSSLVTPQPKILRPMYGALNKSMASTRMTFVSKASYDLGIKEKLGLDSIIYPVHGVRQISKADMVLNTATPQIEVNPETFEVTVDGYKAYVAPAKELPLAQLYWFS
ncbi:MAG: amidohydrolase family protein, partial [Muribaculaceae bacterium]|nr:amidohydrolase family protein [Muribaculaceae bacterium]